MKVVLTIIDTAGIQPYIFGSNRLRENIGASYLVEQATHGWVYDELNRLGAHNISNLKKGELDRSRKIEEHGLAAELVYAGGGNTVILFRTPDEARIFAQSLSRRVLEDAPGLEIVIATASLSSGSRIRNGPWRQRKKIFTNKSSSCAMAVWRKRNARGKRRQRHCSVWA